MDFKDFEELFLDSDLEELREAYNRVIEEEALTQPVQHHFSRIINEEDDFDWED